MLSEHSPWLLVTVYGKDLALTAPIYYRQTTCLVLLGRHVAFFFLLNLCLIKQCSRRPLARAYSYNVCSTFCMFVPTYVVSHEEILTSWYEFLFHITLSTMGQACVFLMRWKEK